MFQFYDLIGIVFDMSLVDHDSIQFIKSKTFLFQQTK